MNKKNQNISIVPEPWIDQWLEHPAAMWMSHNGKQIGYAFLIALMLLIAAYRYLSHKTVQAERDYIQAEQWMSDLNSPGDARSEALQNLQSILTDYPDLEPVYDGKIAQDLILADQDQLAKPFVARTFERVKNETPATYFAYSTNSLLISEGKLEEALSSSYALRDNLLAQLSQHPKQEFGGTLFAFNLIRIAFLEKKMGHPEKERAAWAELQKLSQGGHVVTIADQEMQKVLSHFDDEGASLKEYVLGSP